MNKPLITTILSAAIITGTASTHAAQPAMQYPDCGIIERMTVFSPQLNDSITIDTWLPEDYHEAEGKHYPVVYMHDGQNLFDANTTWNHQAWEIDTAVCRLTASGKIPTPIIVGIHSFSDTRIGDLMPQKAVADSTLDLMLREVKLHDIAIRGDRYAAFVVETLKPLVDTTYRTLPDRSHTSVMGSSMGGLMSLYLICEYPEVFGGAGCLSTHWIGSPSITEEFGGAMMRYMDSSLPDATTHRLYFDHGTETLDAFYGPWEEKALDIVKRHGYTDGKNLDSMVDVGGAHEERAWASRVARPLTFLLSE